MKKTKILLLVALVLSFIGCNFGEFASSPADICVIESKLDPTTFLEISDSLHDAGTIPSIPDSMADWIYQAKIELEYWSQFHRKVRVYYFSNEPVEMYLVSHVSNLSILEYYNGGQRWLLYPTESEKKRIKKQFKNEYVNIIEEAEAKRVGNKKYPSLR